VISGLKYHIMNHYSKKNTSAEKSPQSHFLEIFRHFSPLGRELPPPQGTGALAAGHGPVSCLDESWSRSFHTANDYKINAIRFGLGKFLGLRVFSTQKLGKMTNNQQHQQINNNRDIIAIHPLLDAMGSCFSVRSRDNVIRLSGTSIDSLRSSLLDPNAKNMQMQGQAVNDSSSDKQGNEALETYQSPMLNEIATGAGSEGNPRPLPGVGNDKRRNSTNRSAIANVTNPLTNASSLIRCEYAAKPKADWFVKRGQFVRLYLQALPYLLSTYTKHQ
jgi:hypothetical protein